jgi:hypothetical protein
MNYENVLNGLEPESSIIEFKAAWGKQQGALTIYPARDSMGRYPNVEELSEEEKRNSSWYVTPDTKVKITNGFTLNLANERDREILARVINSCEDVAESFEDSQMKPTAVYYIHSESKEMKVRVEGAKWEYKAKKIIFEDASESEKAELCRLLGFRATDMKPTEIEDFLLSIAKTTPKLVVDTFSSDNKKIRSFLFKALDKGTISIRENGLYEYNGVTLGISEESVLAFLQDKSNQALVVQIKNEVFPKYVQDTIDSSFFDESPKGAAPSLPVSNPSEFGGGQSEDTELTPLTPAQKGAATKAANAKAKE